MERVIYWNTEIWVFSTIAEETTTPPFMREEPNNQNDTSDVWKDCGKMWIFCWVSGLDDTQTQTGRFNSPRRERAQ